MSQKTLVSKSVQTKTDKPATGSSRVEAQHRHSSQMSLYRMHSIFGNRGVQGMYESGAFQAKLSMGKPGDKYEEEADRVSNQVMRMPDSKVRLKPT
jgi:hypothetical protein